MGQVPLAPVARRDAGHHAAGRGLLLLAPGHLPRARRQHGAAGRRQVPCAQQRFFGTATEEDQEYDFYHWSAILRSVSAFEVYRKVYRDVIKPERVAELLILRADMPRSLHASLHEVVSNLDMVKNEQSAETQRRAGKLLADLQYARVDEILATGLHAYLTQFLDRVNELGVADQPGLSGAGALSPAPAVARCPVTPASRLPHRQLPAPAIASSALAGSASA